MDTDGTGARNGFSNLVREVLARISHQTLSRERAAGRRSRPRGLRPTQAYSAVCRGGRREHGLEMRTDPRSQQVAGEKCGLGRTPTDSLCVSCTCVRPVRLWLGPRTLPYQPPGRRKVTPAHRPRLGSAPPARHVIRAPLEPACPHAAPAEGGRGSIRSTSHVRRAACGQQGSAPSAWRPNRASPRSPAQLTICANASALTSP
jgi:hypothetical protein